VGGVLFGGFFWGFWVFLECGLVRAEMERGSILVLINLGLWIALKRGVSEAVVLGFPVKSS